MAKTINSLELYDFVRLPLLFYGAVGIKLFQWDKTDIRTTRGNIIMVVTISNIFVNLSCKLSMAIFAKFDSIGQGIQWFLYLMFASNAFFKMLSVVLGRNTLYSVLKDIQKLYPKTRRQREEMRLIESYSYIRRHSKIMIISHWSIALMFLIFPFVQSLIEYMISSDERRIFTARFPYVLTYPYDVSHGIGYITAYMTQFLGGVTVSCYFIGSDMLLVCTIHLVIMQYAYLRRRIENFKSKDYKSDMKELKEILERHNILNE